MGSVHGCSCSRSDGQHSGGDGSLEATATGDEAIAPQMDTLEDTLVDASSPKCAASHMDASSVEGQLTAASNSVLGAGTAQVHPSEAANESTCVANAPPVEARVPTLRMSLVEASDPGLMAPRTLEPSIEGSDPEMMASRVVRSRFDSNGSMTARTSLPDLPQPSGPPQAYGPPRESVKPQAIDAAAAKNTIKKTPVGKAAARSAPKQTPAGKAQEKPEKDASQAKEKPAAKKAKAKTEEAESKKSVEKAPLKSPQPHQTEAAQLKSKPKAKSRLKSGPPKLTKEQAVALIKETRPILEKPDNLRSLERTIKSCKSDEELNEMMNMAERLLPMVWNMVGHVFKKHGFKDDRQMFGALLQIKNLAKSDDTLRVDVETVMQMLGQKM